jgi:hypothetical protein
VALKHCFYSQVSFLLFFINTCRGWIHMGREGNRGNPIKALLIWPLLLQNILDHTKLIFSSPLFCLSNKTPNNNNSSHRVKSKMNSTSI